MEPVDFINTLDPSCTYVYEGGDVVRLPSALVLLNIRVGYGVERHRQITVQLHYTTVIFQITIEKLFPHRVLFYIWFHTLGEDEPGELSYRLGAGRPGFVLPQEREFFELSFGM
jgi:hypothetical protein